MMDKVRKFVSDCVRLLYWVFFKPTALRAHINQIAPGYEERLLKADRALGSRASVSLRELHENPALRTFAVEALSVILIAPFALYSVTGLTITAFGGDFNWQRGWSGVGLWIVYSLMNGLALGMVAGLAVGVAVSVALGLTLGVAFGLVASIASSVANGIAGGVIISIAFGAAFGTAFGVAFGVAFGILVSFLENIVLSVGVGIGATRLVTYLAELLPAILSYRCSIHSYKFEQAFLRSPICFDQFIFFPQPYLSRLLFHLLQQDLNAGLRHTAFVTTHPYQGWAAQRALKKLLAQDQVSFLSLLDRLLTSPPPYEPVRLYLFHLSRASFRYYSALSMLAEIADMSESRLIPRLGRKVTFLLGLRTREKSRYAPFARVYFDLLHTYWRVGGELFAGEKGEIVDAASVIERYSLDTAVVKFEQACALPHGEEFYQSLRLIAVSLHCESLQQVAKLRDEFAPLLENDDPLRPQIIAVFRRLHDAVTDAASFLTAAHEITRRDALLKAQSVLEEARQLADAIYEPERSTAAGGHRTLASDVCRRGRAGGRTA